MHDSIKINVSKKKEVRLTIKNNKQQHNFAFNNGDTIMTMVYHYDLFT